MSRLRDQLDRALRARGEDVTLRRRIGSTSTYVEITCRALVRGYEAREMSGGIVQGDSEIIMSPSAILAAPSTWPGAAGGTQMPKIDDQIIARGRQRTIRSADARMENGQPVRIDLQVRG